MYIKTLVKDTQQKLKEAQKEKNMDKSIELMKELSNLNAIKSALAKELGERIILKM